MEPLVLFFSCEPGGAEVLIPVINYVKTETTFNVAVLGYGLGGERFNNSSIEYTEIEKIDKDEDTIVDIYSPSIIITSATSLPERDMSEKYLWSIANRNNIPSIAFIDQWQNYIPRFSGIGDDEELSYLPDLINCINAEGRQEMLALGFPDEKLFPLGQPYLSSIKKSSGKLNKYNIKTGLGIEHNIPIALFISEPILEYYGDSRGYDQYETLALFLSTLEKDNKYYLPIVKLHPKDNVENFNKIISTYHSLSPIIITNEASSIELLVISDFVIGMTSVMLIEAYILECLLVSLQPGLKVEDPLILSRLNLIPTVTNRDDFSIDDIKRKGFNKIFKYDFNVGEFKRILDDKIFSIC